MAVARDLGSTAIVLDPQLKRSVQPIEYKSRHRIGIQLRPAGPGLVSGLGGAFVSVRVARDDVTGSDCRDLDHRGADPATAADNR